MNSNELAKAQKRIEQLEAELAEMKRLFDKAMDEWEKERRILK